MVKTLVVVGLLVFVAGALFLSVQDTDVVSEKEPSVTAKNQATTSSSVAVGSDSEEKSKEVETSSGTVVNLSGQGLKKAPDYIFKESTIQTLDLSNNQLEGSLPGEIRFLQALKILDLSNNQFTGVPAEIGQLKNLEVLDLSSNRLTGLPHELGNLSNLKILNLRGNAYSSADLDIIKQQLSDSVEVRVD